jgi:hypothetical protein
MENTFADLDINNITDIFKRGINNKVEYAGSDRSPHNFNERSAKITYGRNIQLN